LNRGEHELPPPLWHNYLMNQISIRPARPADVREIAHVVQPLVDQRILLGKALVDLYGQVQGFLVAVDAAGTVVGCGALHVMWEDLAEIRTLAVLPQWLGRGVGSQLVQALLDRAREMGLRRIFCLTFEVDFFTRHGFRQIEGTPVDADVYAELLRSPDDGVAEFLDLARVKPNTLGNSRMMREITPVFTSAPR